MINILQCEKPVEVYTVVPLRVAALSAATSAGVVQKLDYTVLHSCRVESWVS